MQILAFALALAALLLLAICISMVLTGAGGPWRSRRTALLNQQSHQMPDPVPWQRVDAYYYNPAR